MPPLWKPKGCRSGGNIIHYLDLRVDIARLINERDVHVLYVWSHVEVPGNEEVDELVRQGVYAHTRCEGSEPIARWEVKMSRRLHRLYIADH